MDVVSCSANSAGCGTCAAGTTSTTLALTGSTDAACLLNAPGVDSTGAECVAGTSKAALGAGTCVSCDAGYFALGAGNSVCSPCAAGTYSGSTGAETCDKCESAQLPAMGNCPGTCTAGSKAFTLAQALTGSLPAAYTPPGLLTNGCNLGAGAVFGVTIAEDCSVTVFPLGDAACSDPAGDKWGAVQLKGYVYDANTIEARLPEPYGDGFQQ